MKNSWKHDLILGFIELGGLSNYQNLYDKIEELRDVSLKPNWKSSVRKTIEQHSSDSSAFLGKEDLFSSVYGIGHGVWKLKDYAEYLIPDEMDSDASPANRINRNIDTILRRKGLVVELKEHYKNTCQICGKAPIIIAPGVYYSEAHHVLPLGRPYNGPDNKNNIIIVCPACHVLCDHHAIELPVRLLTGEFKIDKDYFDHHNELYNKKFNFI